MVGKGSQYGLNGQDKDGNYLDGSKNYNLNIPANVPAKDYWSVLVYDPGAFIAPITFDNHRAWVINAPLASKTSISTVRPPSRRCVAQLSHGS